MCYIDISFHYPIMPYQCFHHSSDYFSAWFRCSASFPTSRIEYFIISIASANIFKEIFFWLNIVKWYWCYSTQYLFACGNRRIFYHYIGSINYCMPFFSYDTKYCKSDFPWHASKRFFLCKEVGIIRYKNSSWPESVLVYVG